MYRIQDIQIGYFKLPLEGNLVDALHGKHDNFELITATILLDNGISGVGYTYTGGIGGSAIARLLEDDLKPRLLGRAFDDLFVMNAYMNQCIHYIARGGIASFAISSLDIGLWDAVLKSENKPLADYFGNRQATVGTYYGGIDLMFSEKELLDNIEKQMKKGHTAVKIKLGKENEDEDIARVRAVRRFIGDDAQFAVDANMIWSVEQAKRMAKRLEEFNLFWLEEPTNPDDYLGYAEIGASTTIPIAMGENLHSKYEHQLSMDLGKIKEPIPDCSNVCGISGFFQVAQLAQDRGMKVNSHGMQELHVNVLGALSNAGLVEYHSFPIYEYTVEPLNIVNGLLTPCTNAGTGVTFDWEKIKACQLP